MTHFSFFLKKTIHTKNHTHIYVGGLSTMLPIRSTVVWEKKLKLKKRKHRKFWHGKIEQLNVKNMIYDCWFSWFHMFWWYLECIYIPSTVFFYHLKYSTYILFYFPLCIHEHAYIYIYANTLNTDNPHTLLHERIS